MKGSRRRRRKGPGPHKRPEEEDGLGYAGSGKDTEAVRKKLSEQAMEAQVSAQKAADDAVRAAGGETKRDKLERLFASDAEEVPTDEPFGVQRFRKIEARRDRRGPTRRARRRRTTRRILAQRDQASCQARGCIQRA